MNGPNATELYTLKWLKWLILCNVYFTTIINKKSEWSAVLTQIVGPDERFTELSWEMPRTLNQWFLALLLEK